MPFKETGTADDATVIDRWDHGVGWMAHPGETMRRASHALEVDGDVWVVDPVDVPDLDDVLDPMGEVVGVVCLLDRHQRDVDAVAQRYDVPVYLPRYVDRAFEAPVEYLDDRLPGTDVRVIRSVRIPFWHEAALFDGETLVVADALGTADYFVVDPEVVGVHPMLRPIPPTALGELSPSRILTGHGTGVFENATPALRDAIDHSRGRWPRAWWKAVRSMG